MNQKQHKNPALAQAASFAFELLYERFKPQFEAVAGNMAELGAFMNGGPEPQAFEHLPPTAVAFLRVERNRRLRERQKP